MVDSATPTTNPAAMPANPFVSTAPQVTANPTDIVVSYKGPSLRELATGVGLLSGAVLTAQQMATHLGGLIPAAVPAAAPAAAAAAAVSSVVI